VVPREIQLSRPCLDERAFLLTIWDLGLTIGPTLNRQSSIVNRKS
jgi:hypothetical protein